MVFICCNSETRRGLCVTVIETLYFGGQDFGPVCWSGQAAFVRVRTNVAKKSAVLDPCAPIHKVNLKIGFWRALRGIGEFPFVAFRNHTGSDRIFGPRLTICPVL